MGSWPNCLASHLASHQHYNITHYNITQHYTNIAPHRLVALVQWTLKPYLPAAILLTTQLFRDRTFAVNTDILLPTA